MSDAQVTCIKCKSTQVHAEKRGWKATSGFLGSSKIMLTCLKCGHQFAPGERPAVVPGWMLLLAVAAFTFLVYVIVR
jgi:hypothetical protein